MTIYFNEQEENQDLKKAKRPKQEVVVPERTVADDFHDQVEIFYSLPRKPWPRKEVKFSPSQLGKCDRELYYMNIEAPVDPQELLIPWRARIPRNGTGVHEVTQNDYKEMKAKLEAAGYPCRFVFTDFERIGRRVYNVDGAKVVISGRCDGVMLDTESGEHLLWEKKCKDKRSNWTKMKEPQEEHILQAIAYYLLFGIRECVFEIEVLQKPQWSKINETDIKYFYHETTDEEAQGLLKRLANIVAAVEAGEPPKRQPDKCMFCPYKNHCREDM